jgi:hypothetical protein
MIVHGQSDTHKRGAAPYDTISLAAVFVLAGRPSAKPKSNALGMIPSSYCQFDGRSHEPQREHGAFVAVCGDIDAGNHPMETVGDLTDAFFGPVATSIYSTSGATADNRKWRVIVPLECPLPFAEWAELAEAYFDFMETSGVRMDRCLLRAGQLVYLPNVPPDLRDESGTPRFYEWATTDGPGAALDGAVASEWIAKLRKQREADVVAQATARAKAAAARAAMKPRAGEGATVIETYNASHTVRQMLLEYGYEESPQKSGHWRSPYQTSGSYATQDCGDFWVSLSGSDKAAGVGIATKSGNRTGDAFALFQHFQHRGDTRAAVRAVAPEIALINPTRHLSLVPTDVPADGPLYQLMTAEELSARPPVRWLVRGILPRDGLVAIFGPPGSGKSFLALDLLCAIAKGAAWFGHAATAAPVTYVALEGEAGVGQRVAAYQRRWGPLPISTKFVAQPFSLLTEVDVRALADAICLAGGHDGVICIDTLNRASPGADENDSKDMGRLIDAAKQLQRLTGGVVVLVHHTGKDASKGLRGHSSLIAALDSAIEVTRDGQRREWRVSKSKDGRDGISAAFRLVVVDLGIDEDGGAVNSCIVEPDNASPPGVSKPLSPSTQQAVVAYEAAVAREPICLDGAVRGVHLETWRAEFLRTSTAPTPDAKKKTFQRARDDLHKRGALEVDGDLNRVTLAEVIARQQATAGEQGLAKALGGLKPVNSA